MGFWRKLWTGFKVATNVAIDLQDAKVIRVKELDTVKTIQDVIDKRLPK